MFCVKGAAQDTSDRGHHRRRTKMSALNLDPDNHSARLYALISKLIGKLETEKVTVKELYMALASISRMQLYCQQFRMKEVKDEPAAGSSVRKYEAAFTANDTRRRKAIARSTADDDSIGDLIGDDEGDDDERSAG
jgi:hypothetical protein